MDQDRQHGTVDNINDSVRDLREVWKRFGQARRLTALVSIWPIVAVIVAIVGLTFFILFGFGTGGAIDNSQNPCVIVGPPPPISSNLASCPVAGGKIWAGSYQSDPKRCHCSPDYGSCNINSRRAKSIDVSTGGPTGSDVVLPTIEGRSISWKYVYSYTLKSNDCNDAIVGGCGQGLVFVDYIDADHNWPLHLLPLGKTGLIQGNSYPSGTPVGKTSTTHVHISVGKNIKNPTNPPSGSSDLDPGWIPADKTLGMCVPEPASTGGVCSVGAEGTFCAPSFLRNYFPDPVVANKMSIICNRESGGGHIKALNTSCALPPDDPDSSLDYSGGLMQINLLANWVVDEGGNVLNCYNAFRRANVLSLPECADSNKNPPSYCHLGGASPVDKSVLPCHMADPDLVRRCTEALMNPETNLKTAVRKYNEQGFTPWAAAGA